jgi:hypothetical protein
LWSCSNPAQQNQDQKDNDHETEPSSAIVTGSIEGAAPDPAEATQQDDDQDNEQDRSNGHRLISFVNKMGMQLPIASSHATNKPADTKRNKCRGVGAFLDSMADIILSIHGALTDRLGGI